MNEEIFRKKSLDKVRSPESLDSYIRVSNPGVWLLLISLVFILAGACVWGVFGRVDSTAEIVVKAENGVITGTVSDLQVAEGMTIRVADLECTVSSVSQESDAGGMLCTVTAEADIPDGVYAARLVVESYRPISFVLN